MSSSYYPVVPQPVGRKFESSVGQLDSGGEQLTGFGRCTARRRSWRLERRACRAHPLNRSTKLVCLFWVRLYSSANSWLDVGSLSYS